MKNADDINPDTMTKDELRAFAKGVKAAQSMSENRKRKLTSKISTTGALIKQSFIDHTIKYLVSTSLAIGIFTGAYFYFVNPVVKKVENTLTEVSELKVLHPIENFNKWFSNDTHWWSETEKKESNSKKTDEELAEQQTKTIDSENKNSEAKKTKSESKPFAETITEWFSFGNSKSKNNLE